jgi:hypothetical protein
MWLRQPALHLVDVPDDVPAIPADRCCNCGGTDDVVLEALTLRGDTRLELELPACPRCKWTLFRPAPDVFARCSYALMWSLLLMIAVGLLGVYTGVKPPFGLGTLCAACTAVAFATANAWYATRRPRGAQTSYYQPVRLRGRSSRDGQRFTTLAFTNREIAGLVAENVAGTVRSRTAIPVARVVRRA